MREPTFQACLGRCPGALGRPWPTPPCPREALVDGIVRTGGLARCPRANPRPWPQEALADAQVPSSGRALGRLGRCGRALGRPWPKPPSPRQAVPSGRPQPIPRCPRAHRGLGRCPREALADAPETSLGCALGRPWVANTKSAEVPGSRCSPSPRGHDGGAMALYVGGVEAPLKNLGLPGSLLRPLNPRGESLKTKRGSSIGEGRSGGGTNRSDKGLNLSGSWQQGHSATYNTPSRI